MCASEQNINANPPTIIVLPSADSDPVNNATAPRDGDMLIADAFDAAFDPSTCNSWSAGLDNIEEQAKEAKQPIPSDAIIVVAPYITQNLSRWFLHTQMTVNK